MPAVEIPPGCKILQNISGLVLNGAGLELEVQELNCKAKKIPHKENADFI